MESNGTPGTIQVSKGMYLLLKNDFDLVGVGSIEVKGKGSMEA
jgi:Adenylate and Guanylate cyclase catalytic domain